MFAAALDGRDASNCLNFVRLKVKNKGKNSVDYHFSAALRGKLNDYRFGFDPEGGVLLFLYPFEKNFLLRFEIRYRSAGWSIAE